MKRLGKITALSPTSFNLGQPQTCFHENVCRRYDSNMDVSVGAKRAYSLPSAAIYIIHLSSSAAKQEFVTHVKAVIDRHVLYSSVRIFIKRSATLTIHSVWYYQHCCLEAGAPCSPAAPLDVARWTPGVVTGGYTIIRLCQGQMRPKALTACKVVACKS